MKKAFYFIAALLLFISMGKAKADEGMWLPMYIERLNYVDMQKLGLQLTADEIYSVNHSSMKDAIVGLANEPNPAGFFCTAEIVSKDGLLFTNHHCGYDAIQNHSSVEHDYLLDGFWAMNRSEELPNEGMTASVLIRMEDITDSIIPFLNDTMSENDRTTAIRKITGRLKKAASENGKYNVVAKSFFEGNEFYMFVYLVYKDVRLVGAPPSSIGKFGGDTDNWMWPRHTGDFSIFRIYTAPDGSPAEYSADNVPLQPKYYFPISLDGVKKDDYAMIWGFPGGTERYLTASAVQDKMDYFYPPLIEVFGKKLEIWKAHMDASQEVKIKYASEYASIANTWKYMIGQQRGVKNLDLINDKKSFEKDFNVWAQKTTTTEELYGNVISTIDNGNNETAPLFKPLIYASLSGVGGSGIIEFAQEFAGLQGLLEQAKEEKDKDKKAEKEEQIKTAAEQLRASAAAHFEEYDRFTDEEVFAAMTEIYYNELPADMHPEVLDKMVAKYKFDFSAYANYVFTNSFLSNQPAVDVFLNNPGLKVLDNDPAFQLMQGYMQKIMAAAGDYRKENDALAKAERMYISGMREMQPDKVFYPDANSTMRFSYGEVLDYSPTDAVEYGYVTHLKGVIEKEDQTNDEFYVEPKLIELYETKDYGPYANDDGTMVTCFLTNNDITGGNSGSPVINGKGEMIGLAFDGNWEAMSSDLAFAPELQRTICVDIRYVLFIIDKYAGASNIIDELTIHQKMPSPSRIEKIEVKETEAVSMN